MRFQVIAEHRDLRDRVSVDEAGADRLGHGGAGDRADEVQARRHQNRLPRREHACRDDRRDGVRRVVEPVDEVEADRGDDHDAD